MVERDEEGRAYERNRRIAEVVALDCDDAELKLRNRQAGNQDVVRNGRTGDVARAVRYGPGDARIREGRRRVGTDPGVIVALCTGGWVSTLCRRQDPERAAGRGKKERQRRENKSHRCTATKESRSLDK